MKRMNPLVLIGGAALAYWFFKSGGGLRGLGDADPNKLDISAADDLCDLCSHLIAMEAHLASSAATTGNPKFLEALNGVRQRRREMMSKLLPADAEGESWCIVKHCLGGSMHAREVGDKYLAEGRPDLAQEFFNTSNELKQGALNLSRGTKSGAQCNVCKGG